MLRSHLSAAIFGCAIVFLFPGISQFSQHRMSERESAKHMVHSKDGTPITFRRSGAGPPLILVHGAIADHTRWTSVLPMLEQQFTVYAVDRRGRGGSIDAGEYSIAREAEDIAAVVEAAGEPVILLGHSFGAFCSLEASLLTKHIAKLILYEPPPPGIKGTMPPETANRMRQLLESGDRDGVVSAFMLEVAKIPQADLEMLRSLPAWKGRVAAAHTILREIENLENQDRFRPERFTSMTTPTLLLLGGESPALYADFIRLLNSTLPNSTLSVLPGQKHVAMNTAPELFVEEVERFILGEGR